MKKLTPVVSVIVPSYNSAKYLKECLESVFAQEYSNYEVIVVDDGSTDQTQSVVADFKNVQYLYQENQGHAAALNRGVVEAKGDYLAFIDSDDLWTEDKIQIQMAYAVTHPEVDMIFPYTRQFFSNDIDDEVKKKIQVNEIMPGYFVGGMLISKKALIKFDPFSSDQTIGHFIDWYMKAVEKGANITLLREVLYLRRIHNNNMGITQKEEKHRFAIILKQGLDRRRKG